MSTENITEYTVYGRDTPEAEILRAGLQILMVRYCTNVHLLQAAQKFAEAAEYDSDIALAHRVFTDLGGARDWQPERVIMARVLGKGIEGDDR